MPKVVRNIRAIFAPAYRHKTIEATVASPVPVEEHIQFFLSQIPIERFLVSDQTHALHRPRGSKLIRGRVDIARQFVQKKQPLVIVSIFRNLAAARIGSTLVPSYSTSVTAMRATEAISG